jgi:anti-repressor protein
LEKDVDYVVFHKKVKNPKGGKPEKEYIITIDAAKHIAMTSRIEKGRQVRQ